MAYHDDVEYIEKMRPDFVDAVGEECLRTRGIIQQAMPTLSGLQGTVEWRSDAATLYEQRLRETVELVEGLHDGFDKAGLAITDYAQAQARAKALVADGVAAEGQLKSLISSIANTQSLVVRFSDALRQWNDLRSSTGALDWLAEITVRDKIDEVREQADALWYTATGVYDDAIRNESEARADAVARLASAYKMLPDFLANSPLSAKIVAETPGLQDQGAKYHIGPPAKPQFTSNDDFPYDPNAEPTAGDYASLAEWKAKLLGGRIARSDLDDATALYAHYLDASGTPVTVDYEEAYNEDPNIRSSVDQEIALARSEAERIYRETGQTGFQMTGDPQSVNDLGGYPSTENWQKALGDHQIYGTSDVEVNGNQITMKIKVHAEDMYNFNAGAADIATGAPDNDNGRFSTLGWAKGFETNGEIERTVTWTIGDPAAPQVSDGTGPERGVSPGEDRNDGRGNG